MSYPASFPALDADAVETSRLDLVPRILRLADGDPAFAAQIRHMMWSEYCGSGAPLGRSEDGMMIWWSERLDTLAD
jgi:hypothetical protein